MPQPVLPALRAGAPVRGLFIVLEIESRGGDAPHTLLVLGNATGRIATAPFWSNDPGRLAGVTRGTVVQAEGTVTQYRGRRQLHVEQLHPRAPSPEDLRLLLPSAGPPGPWWEQLDHWREGVRAPRLRRTLDLFFADPDFRLRFEECPASPAGHHARLGGLLQHTAEVAGIALEAARRVAGADPELVLAGALLHDIGKVESYRCRAGFELSPAGAVLGHVAIGALLLDRRVRLSWPMACTEEELLALQHIILAHHGQLEFGAPVRPMTLEAELVHYADAASAHGTAMAEALESPEHFEEDAELSARPVWQVDRRRLWRHRPDWGRNPAAPGGAPVPATAGQTAGTALPEGMEAGQGAGRSP